MPVHLSDTRDVGTIDDAKKLLAELRRLTCAREIIVARTEKKVAEITAKATSETDQLDAAIEEAEKAMEAIIMANRSAFSDKRMMETPDGRFGLRSSSRLEVSDQDALFDCLLDRGYKDCFKVVRTLEKRKITERLENGEEFPGVRIAKGEIASYTIAKALIEEARKSA